MKSNISSYALLIRDRKNNLDILKSKEFFEERQKAEIIRLVHSIEKGLCIENPRLGFGVAKINDLLSICNNYSKLFGSNAFCLKMARDAINEYIEFHEKNGYQNEEFKKICEAYNSFPCKKSNEHEKFGGTLHIKHKTGLSIEQLESFFSDRHSVRDFLKVDVPDEEIFRAIRVAQYAPSACNRQAVRLYVVSSKKVCEFYKNDLSGIGGFAENASKFIFITGKLSAYTKGEYYQHIVSASIFSTYLIEALFVQNIGSCMVQRPLYFSSQWNDIAQEIGVPKDERLVLMIAIGKIKGEYKVPVSKRFPTESIVKFIK